MRILALLALAAFAAFFVPKAYSMGLGFGLRLGGETAVVSSGGGGNVAFSNGFSNGFE